MEVTDDTDPFFLFAMDVNEADFHDLKQDQCLLVDFATFPSKFIELLEKCVIDIEKDEEGDTIQARCKIDRRLIAAVLDDLCSRLVSSLFWTLG